MFKRFSSYTSFSRKEKSGLAVLLVLLLLLMAVKASMHLWVQPNTDKDREQRLRQAWENYKNTQPIAAEPLPDSINLNTADSATLVRLKGIGPVTAHKIMERRTNIGPFTNFDQLRELGSFSDTAFAELKKKLTL
jgi:DNA uptake protein ComE-like DNA-binding protein